MATKIKKREPAISPFTSETFPHGAWGYQEGNLFLVVDEWDETNACAQVLVFDEDGDHSLEAWCEDESLSYIEVDVEIHYS